MSGVRLEIPGHRFVVVSDPSILPAIIGRPGLPKWAAYKNVVPVCVYHKGPFLEFLDLPQPSETMFKDTSLQQLGCHAAMPVQLVARSKVHTLFTTPHSSDPAWKAVRKALNPAFSPTAIK
jgi:hypothetical protein